MKLRDLEAASGTWARIQDLERVSRSISALGGSTLFHVDKAVRAVELAQHKIPDKALKAIVDRLIEQLCAHLHAEIATAKKSLEKLGIDA